MKYAQGFDELPQLFGLWGICMTVVFLTYKGLRRVQQIEESGFVEEWLDKRWYIYLTSLIIPIGILVLWISRCPSLWQGIIIMTLVSIISGCLLTAAVMDLESYSVYNFVWIPAVGAVFLLFCVGSWERVWEALLFALLQETLFAKLYGRADCHAFGVCALAEAALDLPEQAFVINMLVAFALLVIVQGFRHNIGKKWRLKQEIAFLPYITISFWGVLFFYGIMGI